MNALLKAIWNLVFNLTGLDLYNGARYRDWSFYLIELRVDYHRVKNMLAERHFIPMEIVPGETRLLIVVCDMRDVQIAGPYLEVAIQVPVESLDGAPGDTFAHLYLPVTTEAARWPGVDIMGFPKFIANIHLDRDGNQIICQLATNEEQILQYRLEDIAGTKKQFTWNLYGNRKQQIIRTTMELEGTITENDTPAKAVLELGTHGISATLKDLLISDEVIRTVIGNNVSGFLRKPVRIKRQAVVDL
jgi:hypothetical protein